MLGSSVICIIPRACMENSVLGMNKGNKIGRSVIVFCRPRRRMTHIKQMANFAVNLSVWGWVYSLNRRVLLCIKVREVGFLVKN